MYYTPNRYSVNVFSIRCVHRLERRTAPYRCTDVPHLVYALHLIYLCAASTLRSDVRHLCTAHLARLPTQTTRIETQLYMLQCKYYQIFSSFHQLFFSMQLGTFSLSLPVNDMDASLAFYETLGFQVIDGGHMHKEMPDTDTTKWRILQHESVHIGLFQGMFTDPLMTFHPQDVRSIQAALKKANISLEREAHPDETGPASIVVNDPDGHSILFDQF